jgi:hypothetical protein
MGYLRLLKVAAPFLIVAFIWMYITKLSNDLETAKANNLKLAEAVQTQQEVIEQQKKDFERFRVVSNRLQTTLNEQEKIATKLSSKLTTKKNGDSRDLGYLASKKPGLVQNIINKATENVNRCFEIITGSEITEGEKNNECQDYIDSLNK